MRARLRPEAASWTGIDLLAVATVTTQDLSPNLPKPDSGAGFAALSLTEPSFRVVQELGFTTMTPIQAQALPVLLRGDDLVGQSATGSGKTVAFALPLLERLQLERRKLQALVLCPTRELATQVAAAIRTLGRHRAGLRVLTLCGGTPTGPQRSALLQGVHVAVGTPGRVQDHINRAMEIDQVHTVVLDEADRMLDMGFQQDVEAILRRLPRKRQTSFFSATFPPTMAAMSRSWQRAPIHVHIGAEDAEQPRIREVAHLLAAGDRAAALCTLLQVHRPNSALVFCNLKDTVRAVTNHVLQQGFAAAALHGDLDQHERDRVMAKFRNGTVQVLIATDVAARGLDISGLAAVIQYELATKADTWLHRIGRTGRAGAPGLAIALVTPADSGRLRGREDAYKAAGGQGGIERLPLPGVTDDLDVAEVPLGTLHIRGGRKDKLRPVDILGALTGTAGLLAAQVGKIEIGDRTTYVGVHQTALRKLLARAQALRIKGRNFRIEQVR